MGFREFFGDFDAEILMRVIIHMMDGWNDFCFGFGFLAILIEFLNY